jgi:hypothetical protein
MSYVFLWIEIQNRDKLNKMNWTEKIFPKDSWHTVDKLNDSDEWITKRDLVQAYAYHRYILEEILYRGEKLRSISQRLENLFIISLKDLSKINIHLFNNSVTTKKAMYSY